MGPALPKAFNPSANPSRSPCIALPAPGPADSDVLASLPTPSDAPDNGFPKPPNTFSYFPAADLASAIPMPPALSSLYFDNPAPPNPPTVFTAPAAPPAAPPAPPAAPATPPNPLSLSNTPPAMSFMPAGPPKAADAFIAPRAKAANEPVTAITCNI